jgi:predicted DNA-binding protein (MmcQ/YjbR family)
MITHKEVEKYLLSLQDSKLDYPFGENTAVYKVHDKMFALVTEKKMPVQISLKCDPLLAEKLREKYDTVMLASCWDFKIVCVLSENSFSEVLKLGPLAVS